MGGVDFLDSLIALCMIRIRSQNGSKDFCITSPTSIWLWYSAGYDTRKIFTTDGRRPRSTTKFYNGFGVDSMYMTTEGMEV